jgi:murein DD-endopeptidase MepM/ murein hydrolase activator NlpD
MRNRKTIRLHFGMPVNAEVTTNGGHFGAPRDKGRRPHQGQDFKAPLGSTVVASERGTVVYSGTRAGSISKTNYGETVVIDHTPDAGKDERHIYTLYAHLDNRNVYEGHEARKGEKIGISGNTGMMAYYKKLKQSFHLHFEVIDSQIELNWGYGFPTGNRQDPMDYLGQVTTIEYSFSEFGEKMFMV